MSDIKKAYESSHGGGVTEPGGSLLGHIWASIGATLVLGVICCGIYPLIVYGIGQVFFPIQANGSLVKKDGSFTMDDSQAVGSALIGQSFSAPQYFHSRPSAAGNGYDGTSSGGTNLGPLSDKLINGVTATAPAPAPATQAATRDAATAPATTAAVTAAVASAPAPDTQAAATAAPTTASSQAAATTTAPAIVETLSFDGVRLRVIHYAVDNGIAFKLYTIKFDDAGNVVSKTEVPLAKYQDKDGNLKDTDLVDAFPHAGDPADKMPLIAADFAAPIPADAVTASGSGLDPHISPENAKLQAQRIADARKITKDKALQLIDQYTDWPNLGILGDPGVNVLRLNLALDAQAPMPAATTGPAPTTTSTATTAK